MGGLVASASGVLTEGLLASVQSGFDSVVATVGQVIPIAVTASVSVIALTAGVDYALKKVKGVLKKAS